MLSPAPTPLYFLPVNVRCFRQRLWIPRLSALRTALRSRAGLPSTRQPSPIRTLSPGWSKHILALVSVLRLAKWCWESLTSQLPWTPTSRQQRPSRASSPVPPRSRSWQLVPMTPLLLWQICRRNLTTWWHSSEGDHAQPEAGSGAVTPAIGEVPPLRQQRSAPPTILPTSNAGTVEITDIQSQGVLLRTTPRINPNSKQPLSPLRPENRLRGRGARMWQPMRQPSLMRTPNPPGVSPHRETSRGGLRSVHPSPSYHGFLDGPLCMLRDCSTRIPPARGYHPREHHPHQGTLRHGKYYYINKQCFQAPDSRASRQVRPDCPAAQSLRGRRTSPQYVRVLFSPCSNSRHPYHPPHHVH